MNIALKAENKNLLISRYQTAGEIAATILKAIEMSKQASDYIAPKFYNEDRIKTAKLIFYFCKNAIPYKKESSQKQTAKTVARILQDAQSKGGDCKHYATISAAICKSLNIPVKLRLISQNYYDTSPTHIYCVAKINNKDIIIDAVLKNFNEEARYNYKYDIKL